MTKQDKGGGIPCTVVDDLDLKSSINDVKLSQPQCIQEQHFGPFSLLSLIPNLYVQITLRFSGSYCFH